MGSVIITGGTGLVGKRLCSLLQQSGYEVRILTRNPKYANEYKWDIKNKYIDPKVLVGAEAIIHLAGASVGEKRWTTERKKAILESRVASLDLLYHYLINHHHTIQTFISASAVGYYGDCGNKLLTEESPNGKGFLAEVCKIWEDKTEQISRLGISVSSVRIGVVLSTEGGALPKLSLPVKLGISSYIGSGEQYLSWIHIDDLCNLFLHLLKTKLSGVFNACAPNPETNKNTTATIAKVLKRPFIPVPVPAMLLKLSMGEMSAIVLDSQRCDSTKIMESGFTFQYADLETAMHNLFK